MFCSTRLHHRISKHGVEKCSSKVNAKNKVEVKKVRKKTLANEFVKYSRYSQINYLFVFLKTQAYKTQFKSQQKQKQVC